MVNPDRLQTTGTLINVVTDSAGRFILEVEVDGQIIEWEIDTGIEGLHNVGAAAIEAARTQIDVLRRYGVRRIEQLTDRIDTDIYKEPR